jgi:hypothetical protein
MSIWLKKRLALCLGCAVGFGVVVPMASSLRAQELLPETPQAAGVLFGKLLNVDQVNEHKGDYSFLRWQLISREDYKILGIAGINTLLTELQKKSKPVDFNSSLPREESGAMIVDVSPDAKSLAFPVVVVRSGDRYKVDLLSTYRKSFNLGEGDFQKRVFQLTQVALPGLPGADSEQVHNTVCQKNLQELHTALQMYVQDYDEKFPPVEKWSDVLQPYVPNSQVFNCPSAPGGKWGYAFNKNLSGQNLVDVKEPSLTQAFYETTDLRPNATGTGEASAYRHKGTATEPVGAYGITLDGHIRQVMPKTPLEFALKPKVPKMRH